MIVDLGVCPIVVRDQASIEAAADWVGKSAINAFKTKGKEMKTVQEMIAVMQAYADGAEIEVRVKPFGEKWVKLNRLNWNWATCDYRVAVTKPSIDWSHVAPECKWLATDENGFSHLFTDKPEIGGRARDMWSTGFRSVAPMAMFFASFKPGTCDWKDSLVERPEK